LNDVVISILLGVIEGITEFLPVSSTAHLRIAQLSIFHINPDDPFWKMYAIVIQLGAILCLPTYFYGRIVRLLRNFPRGRNYDKTLLTHPISLIMYAFVCTAIPAFLLKKVISANLENLTVIGSALVIGGAVMWAVDAVFSGKSKPEADSHLMQEPRSLNMSHVAASMAPAVLNDASRTAHKTSSMDNISLFQAIWIGLIQTLAAIFPGTSRSMATIAAGQTVGLTREAALEFSFFLSMPTMAVACVYDFYKTLRPGHDEVAHAPLHMDTHQWIVLAIGFGISYIVALGVVAWFMHWVRKRGFVPFAIYRIILGIVVLTVLRSH
jgi:undecaprenyl-diphosphatase